jgi:hypothetical protein
MFKIVNVKKCFLGILARPLPYSKNHKKNHDPGGGGAYYYLEKSESKVVFKNCIMLY